MTKDLGEKGAEVQYAGAGQHGETVWPPGSLHDQALNECLS